jgi:hypothetical protein
MSKKTKEIKAPTKPQPPANRDDWVNADRIVQIHAVSEAPDPTDQAAAEPLVRLTFDIPESLHRRIKIDCAQRGIKRMAVELRRILNQHFPA